MYINYIIYKKFIERMNINYISVINNEHFNNNYKVKLDILVVLIIPMIIYEPSDS